VVPGSLPVAAFGDPSDARVATVSLNPSWHEFLDPSGSFLLGARRRLASLQSLNVADPSNLTDSQVAQVVAESNSYFLTPNWYRRWFHWLEQLLSQSDAGSYLDGTACHLDLVQWATKPVQSRLPRDAWEILVRGDRDFLVWQLETSPVRLVLLNGASVVREVVRAGVVPYLGEEVLRCGERKLSELRVFQADAGRVRFVGWNRPLAGPLPASCRQRLASWVAGALTPTSEPTQVRPARIRHPGPP